MQRNLCQSLCIKPYPALLESACLLMVMASSSKPQLIRLLALLLIFLHLSLLSIVHADPHGTSLSPQHLIQFYNYVFALVYSEILNTAFFFFLLILQKVIFVITTTTPIWMMLLQTSTSSTTAFWVAGNARARRTAALCVETWEYWTLMPSNVFPTKLVELENVAVVFLLLNPISYLP